MKNLLLPLFLLFAAATTFAQIESITPDHAQQGDTIGVTVVMAEGEYWGISGTVNPISLHRDGVTITGTGRLNNPWAYQFVIPDTVPHGSYDVQVTSTRSGHPDSAGVRTLEDGFRVLRPVQVYDPGTEIIASDGSIDVNLSTFDLETLRRPKGTVADGRSMLLLVCYSTEPVTFRVEDESMGGLARLANPAQWIPRLTVDPTPLSDGSMAAVAVYGPPDGLGTEGVDSNGVRRVVLSATYADTIEQDCWLDLIAPPLVLVHDIWSSPYQAWDTFVERRQRESHITVLADYSDANTSTFDPLASSPGIEAVISAVRSALEKTHARGYAATRVDMIGHGVGGLLARGFIQRLKTGGFGVGDYLRDVSRATDPVHRLITIGTPHMGAELPAYLGRHPDALLVAALARFGIGPGSALRDLEYVPAESTAFENMVETQVASHVMSITGIENSETYANWNDLLLFIGDESLASLFPGAVGDGFANFGSQIDGRLDKHKDVTLLGGIVHVPLAGTDDIGQTHAPEVLDRCRQLLITQELDFFAPALSKPSALHDRWDHSRGEPYTDWFGRNSPPQGAAAAGGVSITTPAPGGTIYIPDATSFTITADVESGTTLAAEMLVLVKGIGIFRMPQGPPYQVTVPLSADSPPGDIPISLLAREHDGTVHLDTTSVRLLSRHPFRNLYLDIESLTLGQAVRSAHVSVYALYGEPTSGRVAEISSHTFGTTYRTSMGGSVVRVDPDGRVTAVAEGIDTVFITNTGQTIALPVKVLPLGPASVRTDRTHRTATSITARITPNPTTEQAMLHYTLPSAGQTKVVIVDERGAEVQTVVRETTQPAGEHSAPVETQQLRSGLYFLCVYWEDTVMAVKMMVE